MCSPLMNKPIYKALRLQSLSALSHAILAMIGAFGSLQKSSGGNLWGANNLPLNRSMSSSFDGSNIMFHPSITRSNSQLWGGYRAIQRFRACWERKRSRGVISSLSFFSTGSGFGRLAAVAILRVWRVPTIIRSFG